MVFFIYKQEFSKVLMILFVCIKVIVIMALLCTWTAEYIVHTFSKSLDDCHILEKNEDVCNVNIVIMDVIML